MTCSFLLCREIFHGNALSCFKDYIFLFNRIFNYSEKSVMNDYPLRSVFTFSLNRVNFNLLDQLVQKSRCKCFHLHKLTDSRCELLFTCTQAFRFGKYITVLLDSNFQFISLCFIFCESCIKLSSFTIPLMCFSNSFSYITATYFVLAIALSILVSRNFC